MSDDRDVTQIPVTDFARQLRRVMAEAKKRPVELTKNGKPVAVLLDIERYRELEDQEDVAEDLYWTVVALRQDIEWVKAGMPTVGLNEVVSRSRGSD